MSEDYFLNETMVVLPNFGWKKTLGYSDSKKRRELTSHPVSALPWSKSVKQAAAIASFI
jgi:hypothetical protein